MGRWLFLVLTVTVALGACSLAPERQWYKPDQNYTLADFERDQKACTKNRAIDDACLKELGWIPLSGDPTKPPKSLEQQEKERRSGATSGGRY